MSNQEEGWRHLSAPEQRVQLFGDTAHRPRHRTGVAPAESCAIVAADPASCREFRLHDPPPDRRPAERSSEDDRWAPVAGTVNVETEPPDVYKPARRSNATHGFRIRQGLINPQPSRSRRSPFSCLLLVEMQRDCEGCPLSLRPA